MVASQCWSAESTWVHQSCPLHLKEEVFLTLLQPNDESTEFCSEAVVLYLECKSEVLCSIFWLQCFVVNQIGSMPAVCN
jgi:hypothetical protein